MWQRFVMIIFVMIVTIVPAMGADIEASESEYCQLQMSGEIVDGDAIKFEQSLDTFGESSGETSGNFLCVSGPGGNLAEALKIGTLLYENGIGTVIEADHSCLSACSIVFMMGTVFYYEGVGDGSNSNRWMHVSGKLGFHKPELKLGGSGTFSAAALKLSYDAALQTVLELVRLANLSSRTETMIPSDLIERMFEHDGQDFYFVETTGQTSRWHINLIGFEPPLLMDPIAAHTACSNLGIWQLRYEESTGAAYSKGDVQLVDHRDEGPIFMVEGAFPSDAPHTCLLQLESLQYGTSSNLKACGILGRENLEIGGSDCNSRIFDIVYESPEQLEYPYNYDTRALLAPSTLLSAANTEARKIEVRAMEFLAKQGGVGPEEKFRSNCGFLISYAHVTNVQSFATLRRNPSLSAEIVAEVPLGAKLYPKSTSVEVPSQFTASDTGCGGLCLNAGNRDFSSAENEKLAKCFEDNEFWYEMSTEQGQAGYFSGKFLRY